MTDPRDRLFPKLEILDLSSDGTMDEETEDDDAIADDDIPPIVIEDSPPVPNPHLSLPESSLGAVSAVLFPPTPLLKTDQVPVPAPVSVDHPTLVPDGALNSVGLENRGGVPEAKAGAENKLLPLVSVKQEEEFFPSSSKFLERMNNSGSDEEQFAFLKELERFHRERGLEFKRPRFYRTPLNLLKLWRAVTELGGHERVTACKLWRQVGESFRPPKTCTAISWTFRVFYEKTLLEYEKHKVLTGELQVPIHSLSENVADKKMVSNQTSSTGRVRRDAAARAMQGWHALRDLDNGEFGDPVIKDKNSASVSKRDRHPKNIGAPKRKKSSSMERSTKVTTSKSVKTGDSVVVDIGEPADWVKINVQRAKDCFEVYALVPGLLREEVSVQSDPCGCLIITGKPEQLNNPWGITPFKKAITFPSRIDAHQTSAVVTLHGQLFVRAPFEQSVQKQTWISVV